MIIIPGGPIFPGGKRYIIIKLAYCTAILAPANTRRTLRRLDYPVMGTFKFDPGYLFFMYSSRFASHRTLHHIVNIILERNETTVCDFCLT